MNTSETTISVSVIGTGNVGVHLAKALGLAPVNSRTLQNLPPYSDVIIIAVKDDAVASVAQNLIGRAGIICHTSGSVPLSVLHGCAPHTGVLYPMQTFSKNVALDYSSIPFFTEASDAHTEEILKNIALSMSRNVNHADSVGRKRLHIAAVLSCNFSNHLVALADDLLKEGGLDYRILLPLLHQTIDKLHNLPPAEAQTGPAAREDMNVIASHLAMLAPKPQIQDIYSLLSNSIINKNHNS